ncbi:MAG TPA: DUF1361 domain-containing protein [Candidatus Saccharimonadales bacterium]|nr:DUF1361 domain-containing protein [Candidatus Saccharimonadales bacterium]
MKKFTSVQRVVLTLGFACSASVLLFVLRAIRYDSLDFWFLNWNLFLAWVPLFFVWQLTKLLKTKPWLNWQGIVLTILWLGFLPNSFYISSDLIHLQSAAAGNILYDVVLLLSFSINGYLLGFASLLIFHQALLKRLKKRSAHQIIAGIILLCSFAIYLGRYLRWNTWDVLINPAGLLFDVSDRLLNPSSHPQTFVTTLSFFVLLGSTYTVVWQMVQASKSHRS